MNKLLAFMFTLISISALFLYLNQWHSPKINFDIMPKDEKSWHTMIHANPKCIHENITSMEHTLDVYFIKNLQPNDPYVHAPYFPAINIVADDSCTAWLQIVKTDNPDYLHFIDSWPEGYPFYTRDKNFYDAPSWNYTFFNKAISFWHAHAYAIQIDQKNKTIQCLGGISWGYKLKQFSFQPTMILPTSLTQQDWQEDWKMYQQALPDYQDITK